MTRFSLLAAIGTMCIGFFEMTAAETPAVAAAKCIKGDRKPPYTIG